MKDLDFDELDRAVNSLMATRNTPGATPTQPLLSTDTNAVASPTSAATSEAANISAASEESPVTVNTQSQSAVPVEKEVVVDQTPARTSSTLPTRRSSGRFMDVVHPSSDMRTQNTQTTPTSRQGVSLTPVNSSVTPEAREATPEPVSEPSFPEVPTSEQEAPTSASDWPDPLDTITTPAQVESDATSVTVGSSSPLESTSSSDTQRSPLVAPPKPIASPSVEVDPVMQGNSPFLSDAKVEKRPLGGAQSSTTDQDTSLATASSPEAAVDTPQQPNKNETQIAPDTPLPAELSHDVLAIESDRPKLSIPSKPDETVSNPHHDVTPEQPTAPVSIAQQYKQQPRTGDQSHAPMYDQDARALAHPAEKKSGWLVVIIILLILILGGGGAATLFFLGYL